jgi:flagellar biosynthesis/type III secretory pathway M-ring protein FliF/YscJ
MSEAVRDVNAMFEHLQKQAEAEQSMMKGAIVFAILCVVVLLVLFMNHSSWRKHSMGRVSAVSE